MNLKRDIRTITQTAGMFAIGGLGVGSYLYSHAEKTNRGVEFYVPDTSADILFFSSFAGTSIGLLFGCAKVLIDNVLTCCQRPQHDDTSIAQAKKS